MSDTPLDNSDLIHYVDGSASRSLTPGENNIEYAVSDHEVVVQNRLPQHLSSKAEERFALTRAFILGEEKRLTICTDSKYCFSTAHEYGTLWKMPSFITFSGTEIQHGQLIKNLLDAILLPRELSICKCEAHTCKTDSVSLGNRKADEVANRKKLSGERLEQSV